MKLEEFAAYDGLGLAELVRQRQVTPRELAETMFEGIDLANGRLNMIAGLMPERMPRQDTQASGPFAGVPLLIKDFPVDGLERHHQKRRRERLAHRSAGEHQHPAP